MTSLEQKQTTVRVVSRLPGTRNFPNDPKFTIAVPVVFDSTDTTQKFENDEIDLAPFVVDYDYHDPFNLKTKSSRQQSNSILY